MSLGKAIEATEPLTLRELGSHVHVGPLPLGSVSPMMLPLMWFFMFWSCSLAVTRGMIVSEIPYTVYQYASAI